MAFTVSAIAALDGAGATVTGGLLAGDIAGGGAGPWFLYHATVDGVAGVNKAAVTASNALKVDGSAVTQPVSLASGAAAIAKAEDDASANLDVGVPAMAVRKATPANTSGTDGDYEFLQVSAGRLWASATIDAALPAGANAIGKLAANSGVDIGDIDVTSIIPGSGATNLGKAEDAVHSTGDVGVMALAVRKDVAAATATTDGDYNPVSLNARGATWVAMEDGAGGQIVGLALVTVSTDITRPADTAVYAANDVLADSTSAPTAGGFTFTAAARTSGGGGMIQDACVTISTNAATSLQGEIWVFDQSVTAVNDNAAFSISDADAKKRVAIIPFTTNQSGSLNATGDATNLGIGFTCVGTADLRFLVKVKNAYTPASGEVLTVRLEDPADLMHPLLISVLYPQRRQRTVNLLPNQKMVGAIVGTSTPPTDWSVSAASCTATIMGVGIEGGMKYIDLRINGTSGTGQSATCVFAVSTAHVPGVNGNNIEISAYVRLIAGSLTNIQWIALYMDTLTGAEAYVGGNYSGVDFRPNVVFKPLVNSLLRQAYTITDATAVYVVPHLSVGFATTAAIDVTLRIGNPIYAMKTGT